MPLYEYQCEQCGHRFELIQKFTDPPAERCPKCQGPVRKLLSSPAIQFKGSGWYITDYARAGKTDSPPTGSSSAKTETKSDASTSTSETKSESKPGPASESSKS